MAYATTNPYTGKVEKTFPTASAAEVDAAIAKAHGAFLKWKELPFEERAEVLHRAAQILAENKRAYAEIVTREMGKLVAEAEAEIDICVGMLEYYVKRGADEMAPHFVKAGGLGDTDVMVVNEPMGVIYAVEPWNFPYYQVIRICAPQFTAGNAILLKHASIVPQSALAMEDLFAKAGAPEGLLTAVFAGHEATAQVLADPRVRGVALTGSEGAGAAVAAEAGRNLKKSTLELGGADAYVVLEDADLDKAVQWAVIGRNWNAGQVLSPPSASSWPMHSTMISWPSTARGLSRTWWRAIRWIRPPRSRRFPHRTRWINSPARWSTPRMRAPRWRRSGLNYRTRARSSSR